MKTFQTKAAYKESKWILKIGIVYAVFMLFFSIGSMDMITVEASKSTEKLTLEPMNAKKFYNGKITSDKQDLPEEKEKFHEDVIGAFTSFFARAYAGVTSGDGSWSAAFETEYTIYSDEKTDYHAYLYSQYLNSSNTDVTLCERQISSSDPGWEADAKYGYKISGSFLYKSR